MYKICFDRLLPRDLWTPQLVQRRRGQPARAISPIGKAWPNGSLLRIKFLQGTAAQQKIALAEAMEWPKYANLRFEVTTAADAEIRIAFDKNDGAWSYIGTDCREIPANQPTMNLGFLDAGTATHEFGHAIGLAHEHQNPDGGIQWNEQVVIHDLEGPPNYWDEETIRHNVLEKYAVNQINGTKFDPDSIMLYWFPASWTTNGVGTKQNTKVSAVDSGFVASAKMYPQGGGSPFDTATELKVGARSVSAKIGKAGEEDLYFFNVGKVGRYAVQTGGNTDMFLKLYGPDSATALIAQDNDSGYSANARVIQTLRPGKYLVQVRHFRPTGTGNYTIKVIAA